MSVSSNSSVSDGVDWQDVEPDEEQLTFTSPLGAETFPTLEGLLEHCKSSKGLDLVATVNRLGLDFHGGVKLINFLRCSTRDSRPLPLEIAAEDFADDKYLMPVLENDALLFSLDEILEQQDDSAASNAINASSEPSELVAQNKQLQDQLEVLKEQFANYRLAVEETLDRRWGDEKEPIPSNSAPKKDNGDYYFESYAANEIHETMLKDQVRTDAYRDFVYENKNLFAGKTVLDIGCGTGILSMFCAKAGAAHVIAVDKSDIIAKATENVFNNGLSDKITCLRGAIEDVKLPVDKVDIIVSEWMGYCLLYEAMLPSVLYARDHYLKDGGLLIPSSATLWIAPIEDSEYVTDNIDYWRDVYGFDMKAMQENIYDEVRVQVMPSKVVCGTASPFRCLDLYKVTAEELVFTAEWTSQLTRQVDNLTGFLIWFDNFFAGSTSAYMPSPDETPETWKKQTGDIAFTTGPFGKETHWRQGIMILPPSESAALESGTKLSGTVTFATADSNKRALELEIGWSANDSKLATRKWGLK